ncbi:hypothetical protein SAMN05444280_12129 [Tangfeifania diversioriginum]|uniref:Uncharacterized protein n=1 Tax=Tangfeifania diversioriginum TaxID=1168035 RepID=A0A1M6JU10_9BACT|nr:hypothetical protein SAMN05444280_12129 [Tangfeifania diversioriginum]
MPSKTLFIESVRIAPKNAVPKIIFEKSNNNLPSSFLIYQIYKLILSLTKIATKKN